MVTNQGNQLSEDFKMTELGPLPEEWKVVPIRSLASVVSGGSAPQGDHYFGGNNPFVRVQHIEQGTDRITGWNLITDQAVHDCRLRLFPKGTIVFPKSGASVYLEKRAVLPVNAYVVSHLCALLPKHEIVDGSFLFHLLRQIRFAELKADGYPTLNLSEIKVRTLPLPPLPEQKAIARVLSTIQKAIEAQDKIIAAARQLKKSLMHYLFTYGPVSVAEAEKVPLKETEIGLLPEHWEQKELGELCDITYGVQAAVANLTDSSIGIPILTNINIRNEGLLDISTLRYYLLPERKRERLILKRGDILFNWRSGSPRHVGKSAMFELDGDYTFSSFILRFRANVDIISNEYLFRYLNSLKDIGFFTEKRSQSSVNSVFNASLAARIPVFLPHMPEQTEISKILMSADRKTEAEEKRKAGLQALFKTMLPVLMNGQVRVKQLEGQPA